MKLTNELINSILRKRVVDCEREELEAVLYLFGCTVKEFSKKDCTGGVENDKKYTRISFEIHHRYFFIMEISGDSTNRILSYHNQYFFEMGYAIPTENVAVVLGGVFNMFLPKMPIQYEGPVYDEDNDNDYKLEELQLLLEHLQKEMQVVLDDATDNSKEKKPGPNVEVGTTKIKDLLPGMVGELDERKMAIWIAAINDTAPQPVSGVMGEDGHLWGDATALVLEWAVFLESSVKVGNIKL